MEYTIPKSGIYGITSNPIPKEANLEYDIFKVVFTRSVPNPDRKWYQLWKPKTIEKLFYIYDRTEHDDKVYLEDDYMVIPRLIFEEE